MQETTDPGRGEQPENRPCAGEPGDCVETIAPTSAEDFLRKALGSNQTDVRLPSLLLFSVLLLAVIASWLRRRRAQR